MKAHFLSLQKRSMLLFLFLFVIGGNQLFAQNCGPYTINTTSNWSEIPGIGTCSSALVTPDATHTGNVSLDYQGSNNDVVFNVNNLTIVGNVNLQSTANSNTFTIAPNTTLTIIGDLGDPTNNNLQFVMGDGAVLIVTGTIYGKNNNLFAGSGGLISAGNVEFGGSLDCGVGGCPALDITTCEEPGEVCIANNSGSSTCAINYGGTVASDQSTCIIPPPDFDPITLTASGYTGTILRWESSSNGGVSWVGILTVGSTYDPPPVSVTTMYRVVVLNNTSGTFCTSYSSPATVNVGGPGAAGTITGPATACTPSTGITYTVPAISGATSYEWSYSGTGATINGTSNTVTLDFTAGATSGNLTVRGQNVCGSGTISPTKAIALTVGTVPVLNSISDVSGCNGAAIAAVTVTAASGTISSINWTNSNTAIGLAASGSDGATPFVVPGFTATNTGQNPITSTAVVTPVGTCGSGAAVSYTYTINPAAPTAPTANAASSVGCVQFNANWSSSLRATGYYLDVSTVNTFASFVVGYNNLDVSNVTTYNVTGLTGSTTYYYRVRAYNLCGTSVSSNTITQATTATNTVGAASSTPTLCINTPLTNITHTTTGATGIGAATNLPAGVIAAFAANTITISGTPTASGTFNYSIPLTGGCGTINATGTITVNPLPAAEAIPGGNTSTCTSATDDYSVTSSGLWSYAWVVQDDAGAITPPGNTNLITVTWKTNDELVPGATSIVKTITATVTDEFGCFTTIQWNVTIYRVPETGPQYHIPNTFGN